jgi:hypothetical protein
METNEMTLLEAKIFLEDKRIMCYSEEETKEVQEKLFEIGYYWRDSKKVKPKEFLLLTGDNEIYTCNNNFYYWINKEEYEEISASEIISIKIKKFDPSTLQSFDKVLVRSNKNDIWRCTLFSHIDEDDDCNFVCIYGYWYVCIPYNEDTKHLAGTSEEEPEYYRLSQ